MVTSAAFKRFMDKAEGEYPYCDLRVTRSNYHCKWLLLKAPKSATLRSKRGAHYVLHSSCLPKKIQRDMIRSGTAFPLPPHYDDVVDCIETWGRDMKKGWDQNVYEYMYESIHDGDSKRVLFGECIFLLIRAKVNAYFPNGTTRDNIMQGWVDYYEFTFEDVTQDFSLLTIDSINFVDWLIGIHREDSQVNTAVATPQLDPDYSLPNVVPLSPVSSSTSRPGLCVSTMESA